MRMPHLHQQLCCRMLQLWPALLAEPTARQLWPRTTHPERHRAAAMAPGSSNQQHLESLSGGLCWRENIPGSGRRLDAPHCTLGVRNVHQKTAFNFN